MTRAKSSALSSGVDTADLQYVDEVQVAHEIVGYRTRRQNGPSRLDVDDTRWPVYEYERPESSYRWSRSPQPMCHGWDASDTRMPLSALAA